MKNDTIKTKHLIITTNGSWTDKWVVMEQECGKIIGSLVFESAPINNEVKVAIDFDDEYINNEFAVEAINAAIDKAFKMDSKLYFVIAEAEQNNTALKNTLENLGFKKYFESENIIKYDFERPSSDWFVFYMCIGMSMGTAIALYLGNIVMGSGLGMSVGVCVGLILDKYEKKKKDDVRNLRINQK